MAMASEPAWAEMPYHERRILLLNANKNQRPDQIRSDLKLVDKNKEIRSDQISFCMSFEQAHALALSWGLHEGNFIKARARGMSNDWITKQVNFVANRRDITAKGKYLAKILANNTH